MTVPAQTSFMTDTTTAPTTEPPNPGAAPDPATETQTPEGSSVETGGTEGGSEGQPPSEPEPLTLDQISLPEGFEMPEEVGAQFLDLLNNPPQSRTDLANQMIGLHTSLLEKVAGEYATQWEETQQAWQKQIRELPEIGGANLAASQAEIAKVLDRYGDKEARDALALTGAGNHPALVRLFYKIAKDVNEAPPVAGTPPTGAPSDRATRMFGKSEG